MLAVVLTACDSPSGVSTEVEPHEFPAVLSALDVNASGTHPYAPRWELWTNGALKERRVWLSAGGTIETRDRDEWSFPGGTRLTKTFSYYTEASPDALVPIETRVILRTAGRWETAVYRWRDDLSDADLLPGDDRVPVPLTLPDGTTLTHLIPSLEDCESCHDAEPSFVLGFSELQLNAPLAGGTRTQLEQFADRGYFARTLPADPVEVAADDATTRSVIGYMQGNCVHCHNADSPVSELDLSHRVFLDNTVNRTASNGQLLISPGSPATSYLYEQFASGRMPRLGVQRLDVEMRELLWDWILTHDFDG